MKYLATFHTHLSAMRSCRALSAAGVEAAMEPVPRKLSSSCGTCVRYEAPDPQLPLLDQDGEAVYQIHDSNFHLVHTMAE